MGWVEIGPLNAHLLIVTLCGAENDNCDDEEGKFVGENVAAVRNLLCISRHYHCSTPPAKFTSGENTK